MSYFIFQYILSKFQYIVIFMLFFILKRNWRKIWNRKNRLAEIDKNIKMFNMQKAIGIRQRSLNSNVVLISGI